MSSIEWLLSELEKVNYHPTEAMIMYANRLHKQEIIDAWNSAGGGDAYHQGKEYYQETFVSKGSDDTLKENHIVEANEMINHIGDANKMVCVFEQTTDTSSATICKHCGQEKFMHQPSVDWNCPVPKQTLYTEEQMNSYAEYCTTHVLTTQLGHPYLSVKEFFKQPKKD